MSVNFCSSVNDALSVNKVYLSYEHNLEPLREIHEKSYK